MIFTKSAFSKNIRKKLDFTFILGGENEGNSIKNGVRKYVFLATSLLSRFFPFWAPFWSPGPSQKSPKNQKNTQQIDFGVRLGRVLFRRRLLGGLWEGFGWVLGGFWEDFGRVSQDFGRVSRGFEQDFGRV